METEKSWIKLNKIGKKNKAGWKKLSKKHKLNLNIYGSNVLPTFSFETKRNSEYLKFITEEMLKRGFLFKNTLYVALAHSNNLIKKYFEALDNSFKMLKNKFN